MLIYDTKRLTPQKSEVIENFLLNFQKSNTISSYKSHLTNFFNFLGMEPDSYFDETKTLDDYTNDVKRFASYAQETKDMDINEAERVIQEQAEIFEKCFNYLRSIY